MQRPELTQTLLAGGMDTAGYTNLAFWIHGGASTGQRLQVEGILGATIEEVRDKMIDCATMIKTLEWPRVLRVGRPG